MPKKILIISSSPRKNGNSDLLCDEFKRGAIDKGHQVEKIFLSDKNIEYCDSCYRCQTDMVCQKKDDMKEILDKLMKADIIVLSSPVYFYSICGQLKTFMDRCLVQWKEIKDKEFYYILTAAQDAKQSTMCALGCMRGFAVCLQNSKEKGIICARGISPENPVSDTNFPQEAYNMGYSI